jgi:hypothetical protein
VGLEDSAHPTVAMLFPVDVTIAAWRDAVEAFELLDGVDHSLERRRTIDLHHEPVSERTIFKTQMTAMGCGVLMATLLLMLVYLALGQFVAPDNPEHPELIANSPLDRAARTALLVLRVLVFAPLFAFLAAQLLLPLSRPSRRSSS